MPNIVINREPRTTTRIWRRISIRRAASNTKKKKTMWRWRTRWNTSMGSTLVRNLSRGYSQRTPPKTGDRNNWTFSSITIRKWSGTKNKRRIAKIRWRKSLIRGGLCKINGSKKNEVEADNRGSGLKVPTARYKVHPWIYYRQVQVNTTTTSIDFSIYNF